MIDTLLKNDLPQAYGLTRPNVQLRYQCLSGQFELGDAKACANCENRHGNACNQKTMRINASNYVVTVVEHEDYINQFNGKQLGKGKRCDYLMCDMETHHKIVFCDLGCYSEQYVKQKQEVTHRQVCDSLKRFLDKPCGKEFIDRFTEKILIFGRRDRAIDSAEKPTPKDKVKENMQTFLTNPFSKSKILESKEVIGETNVTFLIVNYPASYVW